MNTGQRVRLDRLLAADGRAVIVAMDHGLPGMGPLGHLSSPASLLGAIAEGGADAVLTTPGIVRRFATRFRGLGLIVRIDGGATTIGDAERETRLIASVEDAARLGADAVAVMGFCGTDDESASLATLGRVAVECRAHGLVLMAEMLPLGFTGEPTVHQIAVAARIGAELGADLIKTKYRGPADDYREVVDGCFVPVIVLGGGARDLRAVTEEVREAIVAGVAGVAMGRNVWRAPDPRAAVAEIAAIVHGPGGRSDGNGHTNPPASGPP